MKCKDTRGASCSDYCKPRDPKQFTKLSKVGSANEVFEVNTMHGTNLVTSSTTCTLRVIDNGEIILNLDRSLGTGLLTLHTTDTTVRAYLTCGSTLIVAGALNNNSGLFA